MHSTRTIPDQPGKPVYKHSIPYSSHRVSLNSLYYQTPCTQWCTPLHVHQLDNTAGTELPHHVGDWGSIPGATPIRVLGLRWPTCNMIKSLWIRVSAECCKCTHSGQTPHRHTDLHSSMCCLFMTPPPPQKTSLA